MKALTLMMTLALLTSATAFADDGGEYPRTRDERNSCDGYPETCEDNGPTILLHQKWENVNQDEDQAKDPGEEIGSDGLPLFCHLVDPYKAYGSRVDTECKAKKILFNQKLENPNESDSSMGGEGPGFVPYKHCVTGELVSLYKWQQDCGVPVHSECKQILTNHGYETSCK
ncbi:MAG: hypothetical protein ACXWQO_16425 [Bdellovibrionota bacterium]